MEVEPWEALDVDDSDLPSLLRPCKRRRSTFPTTTSAGNLISQSLPEENHPQPPPPSTSHLRTIPGPAGAVQSAMLRKNLDRQHHNFSHSQHHNPMDFNDDNCNNNAVISTQDYIRRAMEDTAEFDDDFTRHPWLSALQFLGAVDGVVRSTPISSIKKCLNADKVHQVVAVIKTCTPNGLGGLKVMLKDPKGTIGGSIHHKVLRENELGKNITIGAVLIIQKVAVFSPVRSAHYLNITLRNLVKVFCQDGGSSSKTNNSVLPIQYADPDIEYCGKAKTLEKISTLQNSTNKNTAKEKSEYATRAENLQKISSDVRIERINLSQDACNRTPEDMIGMRFTGDSLEFVNGSDKGAKGGNLEGNLLDKPDNMTNAVEKSSEEIQATNEGQMQRQPQLSKSSLPQWTDEQLNELFAGDEEDDSLF